LGLPGAVTGFSNLHAPFSAKFSILRRTGNGSCSPCFSLTDLQLVPISRRMHDTPARCRAQIRWSSHSSCKLEMRSEATRRCSNLWPCSWYRLVSWQIRPVPSRETRLLMSFRFCLFHACGAPLYCGEIADILPQARVLNCIWNMGKTIPSMPFAK
jgi:hypothetical protein